MNVYLIKVEILNKGKLNDENHLSREFGLVTAENYGEAERKAIKQVAHDNDPMNSTKFWVGSLANIEVKLKSIEPLSSEDLDSIQKHGIACFIEEKHGN